MQNSQPHRTKKIGVLTFHRCINYGSYWQAKCLVDSLLDLGYDATILDHVSPEINIKEWRCAMNPTLPIRSTREDVERYRCKVRKFQSAFLSLPLSQPFNLDHPETLEGFDTVVLGSDEVWNLRHPWYAGKTAFFGDRILADRVVAYGASFGNYSCWEGIGSPWTEFLAKLDAISVRDENSWWMLKNALAIEPETVLDPCLLRPPEPTTTWTGPSRPFALVYGHNFSESYSREVRRWADTQGLLLLSIGYRNDWADLQWLEAGPHEFAAAMSMAQAVATNFFHGCVFAINNGKPFACEYSEYRSIKVRGLLELFGGQNHLVGEKSDGDSVASLLSSPSSSRFSDQLPALRRRSERYLAGAI